MKHFLLTLPSLLLIITSSAQTIRNNQIVLGTVDSIHSTILGEDRKVWVYVPNSDDSYAPQRYPVVYLLDGEAHFASVVGMVQQLSQVNGNMICPPLIVIGIPNTNRFKDLTPTRSLMGMDGKPRPDAVISGGGEKFAAFLEKELIPHIDSLYPTAPHKTIIGHSLGGLTVMNLLLHHPAVFNSYIAIDPSMWWDDNNLLKKIEDTLSKQKWAGKSLFVGIAHTGPYNLDTVQVRTDTAYSGKHIRSILQLCRTLNSQPETGLRFHSAYYADNSHGSVPLIAEYDALHFLFSAYPFPPAIQQKLEDAPASIDVAAEFTRHYQEVSRQLGYQVLPPEQLVNEIAGYYLQFYPDDNKSAKALLNLNILNYPQRFNGYDSMGDYYLAKKDKTKAIEYFRKALQLKDNAATRTKLNKLLTENKPLLNLSQTGASGSKT